MCKRCVRADRREAEGRPARWQVGSLSVFIVADISRFQAAMASIARATAEADRYQRNLTDAPTEAKP